MYGRADHRSCRSAAKALAMESGFKMEHPSILAFRQAVLSGDWRSAERLLFDGLNSAASRIAARSAIAGTSSSAGLDLVLRDPRHLGIEVSRTLSVFSLKTEARISCFTAH